MQYYRAAAVLVQASVRGMLGRCSMVARAEARLDEALEERTAASKTRLGVRSKLLRRVLTRIGTCDSLESGGSTFACEMRETQYILNSLGGTPALFIRYNPDRYRPSGTGEKTRRTAGETQGKRHDTLMRWVKWARKHKPFFWQGRTREPRPGRCNLRWTRTLNSR